MRVIFRAEFQGPKGPLNPLNLGMSRLVMKVDVFRKGDKWLAKSNGNPLKLSPEPTHGCAKDAVDAAFEKRLTPWIMCHAEDGLPLDPDYIEETPDGKFSAREVTHCGSRKPEDCKPTAKGPNYYRAACGEEVHAALIRSFRAPHPPLCKECRKEWEKTPAEERFKS